MRYPPVNFRRLRQFLNVARVDHDQTAKCLHHFLVQTALNAPSPERDHVRGLVEMATDHRNLIPTAITALDAWARSAATETGRTIAERRVRANIAGKTGNANKAKCAVDKHAEWQEEANRLWRLRYDRKKLDVAIEIAENCGGGKPSYIQSIIRKPPKKL